jgi:hypothetical protein
MYIQELEAATPFPDDFRLTWGNKDTKVCGAASDGPTPPVQWVCVGASGDGAAPSSTSVICIARALLTVGAVSLLENVLVRDCFSEMGRADVCASDGLRAQVKYVQSSDGDSADFVAASRAVGPAPSPPTTTTASKWRTHPAARALALARRLTPSCTVFSTAVPPMT